MSASAEHARLAAELHAGIAFVEETVIPAARRECERLRQAVPAHPDRVSWILSSSKCLHDFYAAVEQRIFERIADETGEGRPRAADYHARLLEAMGLDLPGLRPAVLSEISRQRSIRSGDSTTFTATCTLPSCAPMRS